MKKALVIILILACIFAFVVCFGGSIIISIHYDDGNLEAQAEEEFYHDENNAYFFPTYRSGYITVTYLNGYSEKIISALESGRVTIADLDRFDIKYFTKRYTKPKR